MRLINQDDEQLGVVPTNEAMRLAREVGMDLVEVAPAARPPVCKIMDYGKWRYQAQKKEDRSRANSKGGQLKELKLRTVKIGDNDLMVKVNHARTFLKEGNKVQFTLQFRGREMAHTDLGRGLFTKIKAELATVSKVERDSKMEGRRMTLVLQPDHKVGAPKRPQAPTEAATGERLNIPADRPSSALPTAPTPTPAPAEAASVESPSTPQA